MERVIESIKQYPGVVMYTLVDKALRDQLRQACFQLNIPCIPVIGAVVSELVAYLGVEVSASPGKQHELNEEYFSKVDAINFAIEHDDGQGTWELEDADIVIVGVSRTSKTPTCVYLAHRGYKAANIPFVNNCPLPDNLTQLRKPLVLGLTISKERLLQIRKSRLQSLNQDGETNYIDEVSVQEEIEESRRLFKQNQWPVIDVTRRSVEETAANIIQMYHKHREKRMSEKQA
jgi:regulator of PEP synthase PpsR (kinase-PPPase family)